MLPIEAGSNDAIFVFALIVLLGVFASLIWKLLVIFEKVSNYESEIERDARHICRNCSQWRMDKARVSEDPKKIECPCIIMLDYTHERYGCAEFEHWQEEMR